jgi:hypothetical protein
MVCKGAGFTPHSIKDFASKNGGIACQNQLAHGLL